MPITTARWSSDGNEVNEFISAYIIYSIAWHNCMFYPFLTVVVVVVLMCCRLLLLVPDDIFILMTCNQAQCAKSLKFKVLPVTHRAIVSHTHTHTHTHTNSLIHTHSLTHSGRAQEKNMGSFWFTPDNQFIVFAGKDGHLLFVSRKVESSLETIFYGVFGDL